MKLRPSAVALATAVAATLSPFGLAAQSPAHADRCQPEELVLGPNTSPIDERDQPACAVLFFYVYPFICSQSGSQPPPTLANCLQNIRLNPGYRPPLVPPYSPNVGRAFCNLYFVAQPNGTCTFVADAKTGDITATTDNGVFTIPTEVTR